MPKKIVRDYRAMTDDELRATVREARSREESAPEKLADAVSAGWQPEASAAVGW